MGFCRAYGARESAVKRKHPGTGDQAMSDDFNMTMRKFLKQVGVTSQQAIEDAMRDKGLDATAGKSFSAKMVLTVDGLDVEHVVTGTIAGRSE
jgi:hypothetical protein